MAIRDLFKGVAVVIDDEINDDSKNISAIVDQISNQGIPLIKFDQLPNAAELDNFRALNFLLLDWDLTGSKVGTEDGVKIPAGLKKQAEKENIEFILNFKQLCYCPVFIFSNEDIDSIKRKLKKAGLISDDSDKNIFVHAKEELTKDDVLFTAIESWVEANPSIYVLKEWEREYQESRSQLFADFESMSPDWSRVIWNTFKQDGVSPSLELGDLISRNITARMTPFEFDSELIEAGDVEPDPESIRSVLEGGVFVKDDRLHQGSIAPGDVFKIKKDFFINIRAACDCIPTRGGGDQEPADVDLYLLKGRKLTNNEVADNFSETYGNFSENESQAIIFPIADGKGVIFNFKTLIIKRWSELGASRIGRIIPPYISKLQQRYASYHQRHGLPRIPEAALPETGRAAPAEVEPEPAPQE